jgi:hypothetical protein
VLTERLTENAVDRNRTLPETTILVFHEGGLLGSVWAESDGWRRRWYYATPDGVPVAAGWSIGSAQGALYAAIVEGL